MPARLTSLELLSISIPFRSRFSHATAQRDVSENLIVVAKLSDGTLGYGEAIARTYVSGETVDTAAQAVRSVLAPLLNDLSPASFADFLNSLDTLPLTDPSGRPIVAARCATELALLDAFGQHFRRGLQEIAGWLGLPGFTVGGSLDSVRFSGMLSADHPRRVARNLWKMRLFGLRDFKIKLGGPHDAEILKVIYRQIGGGLRRGKYSLRADVNGVWDLDQALATFPSLANHGVCCVEQPLPPQALADFAALHAQTNVPIMVDESLVLPSQAQALIDQRCVDYFNIRISKNGGLIPAMRLAHLARKTGLSYQLGCMVGETAILSAAGRWFLSMVPQVKFAEGSWGTILLSDDISTKSSRFGYGGRIRKPVGPGMGITIDPEKLRRYRTDISDTISF